LGDDRSGRCCLIVKPGFLLTGCGVPSFIGDLVVETALVESIDMGHRVALDIIET
jgi:hypothetical protein